MDKVKFKIQITGKDMGKFILYHQYHRFSGIFSFLMGIVALVFDILFIIDGESINSILFFTGMFILFTMFFPFTLYRRGLRQVENNKVFSKPLFYTLTKDGIEINQEQSHDSINYENCLKAIKRKNYIYIYTSKINAFIFPLEQLKENCNDIVKILGDNMPPNKKKGFR